MDERPSEQPGSVGYLLKYLAPELWLDRRPPSWPPDAFALAAATLFHSGSYAEATNAWPPPLRRTTPRRKKTPPWSQFICSLGKKWALAAEKPDGSIPSEARAWWETIVAAAQLQLREVSDKKHRAVLHALLQLLAAADEACAGVGLSSTSGKGRKLTFLDHANDHLWLTFESGRATLCKDIRAELLQVLPKAHTPQQGLTLRSMSHHLAFCPAGEVAVSWVNTLYLASHSAESADDHCLNLLLVPWPERVHLPDFKAAMPRSGSLKNIAEMHGFFNYTPSDRRDAVEKIVELFKSSCEQLGRIDGIILPELAMSTSNAEKLYDRIYEAHRQMDAKHAQSLPFLLTGVGEVGTTSKPSRNAAFFMVAIAGEEQEDYLIPIKQKKNHRWKLTGSQIEQYSLGSRLDPVYDWWENIEVSERELWFLVLRPWLALCALVCEDLARPDPIGDLVRAVGPNLVIALLMDGPQLKHRWPARYATVLAEDPGSSVLTLTSLGMAQQSQPPGYSPSRVIALWKDALSAGPPIEIEMPQGAEAMVVTLARRRRVEWSADGRSDLGKAAYIQLAGRHPIYRPKN